MADVFTPKIDTYTPAQWLAVPYGDPTRQVSADPNMALYGDAYTAEGERVRTGEDLLTAWFRKSAADPRTDTTAGSQFMEFARGLNPSGVESAFNLPMLPENWQTLTEPGYYKTNEGNIARISEAHPNSFMANYGGFLPILAFLGAGLAAGAGAAGTAGATAPEMGVGGLGATGTSLGSGVTLGTSAAGLGTGSMATTAFDPNSLGSWDIAGGGNLMPAPGMPPAIEGGTSQPFLSSSGNVANVYGTPESLTTSYSMGSPGVPYREILDRAYNPNAPTGPDNPAPVEDLSRGYWNPANNSYPFDLGNRVAGLAKMAFNAPSSIASNLSTLTGWPVNTFNMVQGGMDIGSGILGLLQRRKMQQMANRAFDTSGNITSMLTDPNNPNYAYADARALLNNPNMITGLPGYQFGMDQGRLAIQRRAAAEGGGGNEDIALARYTPEYAQRFFEQEFARRMALGQGAAQGQTTALAGANNQALPAAIASNDLYSRALASIGYGVGRLGGTGGNSYDNLIKQLLLRSFT